MNERTTTGIRQYGVLAWLRLARVFQKIEAASERFFRSQGLNSAQFDVLAQVGSHEGLTQQELADALLVTKGNISQLLARMEQERLITRRHEGRSNILMLTKRGSERYAQVAPQQEALIASLLAPLSLAEQRELLRLLRKLDQQIAER
jgi:DNA-binding MarR family transcriptional regulator